MVMVERGYVTFLFQGGGAQPEPSSGSGCPAAWFNLVGVAATILHGGMAEGDASGLVDGCVLCR